MKLMKSWKLIITIIVCLFSAAIFMKYILGDIFFMVAGVLIVILTGRWIRRLLDSTKNSRKNFQ